MGTRSGTAAMSDTELFAAAADPELVARSLADLLDDPDEQIRELARTHLTAEERG